MPSITFVLLVVKIVMSVMPLVPVPFVKQVWDQLLLTTKSVALVVMILMKMVSIVLPLKVPLSPCVFLDMVLLLLLVKNVKKKTVTIVLVMPPSVLNVLKVTVYLLMVNVLLVLVVVPIVSPNVCLDV